MLYQPTIVKSVIHPMVASAYIKHNPIAKPSRKKTQDILVLDAYTGQDLSQADVQCAILSDIDLIMDQLRADEVAVDSVEIRFH